jgi:hypothetical protein
VEWGRYGSGEDGERADIGGRIGLSAAPGLEEEGESVLIGAGRRGMGLADDGRGEGEGRGTDMVLSPRDHLWVQRECEENARLESDVNGSENLQGGVRLQVNLLCGHRLVGCVKMENGESGRISRHDTVEQPRMVPLARTC